MQLASSRPHDAAPVLDLVAVGDLMLDVRTDAGSLRRGGDVHGRVLVQPGGTSANAAVWAAWSGAAAGVIGAVGEDAAGDLVLDAIAARGVDTTCVRRAGAETGTMLVLYEAGERSMVADRGANAELRPGDVPDRVAARAVLVSGYLLLQPPTTEAGRAVIDRAAGDLVAVDAASWPLLEAFGVDRFLEATATATAVLANDREATVLTGLEGMPACRSLGERYRIAAVKRGAEGACLSVDGVLIEAPAEPVDEVDPTGAGDAFDGVLLATLARGEAPDAALAAACRAGARVAASANAWPAAGPTGWPAAGARPS